MVYLDIGPLELLFVELIKYECPVNIFSLICRDGQKEMLFMSVLHHIMLLSLIIEPLSRRGGTI